MIFLESFFRKVNGGIISLTVNFLVPAFFPVFVVTSFTTNSCVEKSKKINNEEIICGTIPVKIIQKYQNLTIIIIMDTLKKINSEEIIRGTIPLKNYFKKKYQNSPSSLLLTLFSSSSYSSLSSSLFALQLELMTTKTKARKNILLTMMKVDNQHTVSDFAN